MSIQIKTPFTVKVDELKPYLEKNYDWICHKKTHINPESPFREDSGITTNDAVTDNNI